MGHGQRDDPEGEEGEDEDIRRYSTADIDLYASWVDLQPYEGDDVKGVPIETTYASFDIECNSKNHNSKLPDPTIPENKIVQIATVVGKFGGKKEERRSHLFSLANPKDIPGAVVHRFKTEDELLLAWSSFINEENPDVFLGYNIMKFDWNYMIERAELLGIYHKFAQMSRLIGKKGILRKVNWSSSAYGSKTIGLSRCRVA